MARLYKGSEASSASNARSSGRSSVPSVPFQPVRGGTKVLGSKKPKGASESGKFKLQIKTTKK